jgi:hypothetical protein
VQLLCRWGRPEKHRTARRTGAKVVDGAVFSGSLAPRNGARSRAKRAGRLGIGCRGDG